MAEHTSLFSKTTLAAPQDVSVDADRFDTFEHIPALQKCKKANSFFFFFLAPELCIHCQHPQYSCELRL